MTVRIFQARLSREGAKAEAINCHEDRVPCDCRHFRKRTPTNKAAITRTVFPDRPDPCDSWPIATLLQVHQKDNCDKDRGPTVNKAIIVSRHVGRRCPTTNQRNTKMIVIMMIMIIVIIMEGGEATHNHTTPHHRRGGKQPTTTPHHRERGGGRPNRDHIYIYICLFIYIIYDPGSAGAPPPPPPQWFTAPPALWCGVVRVWALVVPPVPPLPPLWRGVGWVVPPCMFGSVWGVW